MHDIQFIAPNARLPVQKIFNTVRKGTKWADPLRTGDVLFKGGKL